MVSGEFILQQSHHSCSSGYVWKSAVLQAKHMVREKPKIFTQDCLREGFLNEGKFTEYSPNSLSAWQRTCRVREERERNDTLK